MQRGPSPRLVTDSMMQGGWHAPRYSMPGKGGDGAAVPPSYTAQSVLTELAPADMIAVNWPPARIHGQVDRPQPKSGPPWHTTDAQETSDGWETVH